MVFSVLQTIRPVDELFFCTDLIKKTWIWTSLINVVLSGVAYDGLSYNHSLVRVRLIITKLPQPVVNTKACNFPLMFIVLLLLKVLTNAPVGVTVDNKILKSWTIYLFI